MRGVSHDLNARGWAELCPAVKILFKTSAACRERGGGCGQAHRGFVLCSSFDSLWSSRVAVTTSIGEDARQATERQLNSILPPLALESQNERYRVREAQFPPQSSATIPFGNSTRARSLEIFMETAPLR